VKISGFRCDVDEVCDVLEYYPVYSGNYLLTFRDNLSGPIGCPETSVKNYHYAPHNIAEKRSSQDIGNVLHVVFFPFTVEFCSVLCSLCCVPHATVVVKHTKKLTSHEVAVVKLTHCVGLKPRDAVAEITVKDGESLLRQKPCVGNVDLQSKAKQL